MNDRLAGPIEMNDSREVSRYSTADVRTIFSLFRKVRERAGRGQSM